MNDSLKKIRLAIFDVDGVLTNGQLYFGDDGQEYKAFNAKDGHGMKMLMSSGIEVAIITARSSNVVKYRMENLGITHFYQGQSDKAEAYEDLLKKLSIQPNEVAYVGDDIIDLPVMSQVGMPVAVGDAVEFVKSQAKWVLAKKGGEGAVREFCDTLLDAQNLLDTLHQSYLR